MPLYDRRCSSCEAVFEISCKISEKSNEFACPECNSTAGAWQFGTPMSISPERLGRGRDGGMKEVLQKIHSAHPRGILKERNSF